MDATKSGRLAARQTTGAPAIITRTDLGLPSSGKPLHERVADGLTSAIENGDWSPGDRLPTHRELSQQLSVSIGTITKAIDSLSRRGLVRGEIGRGTFVATPPAAIPFAAPAASDMVDLTINAPPPVISADALAAAAELAARRAFLLPNGGYVDITGAPEHRAVLADWLSRTRLAAAADELIVCVGAQQAIHFAFADLKPQSLTIATEAATYSGAIAAARNLGMELRPVASDSEGMLPQALDAVLKDGCRIVYTTPVCQNPLGFETGPERRKAILEVCRRRGATIVEDDIYGLYSAKGRETYKSMAPDAVYFVTGLSKCLTPLVRLGILVPPRERRPTIAFGMRAEIWGAPPLGVATACALIEAGEDVAAATALKSEAAVRLEATAEIFGLDSLPMPEGAPHVWLPMPLIEAERLARRAGQNGVKLTPPDATMFGDGGEAGIRLCIMAPRSREALYGALRTIARLVEEPAEAIV